MSTPERLDDVEDAILRADPPVVTAPEIAEILIEESSAFDDVGDPRREVYANLTLLERAGVVDSKQTGSRARAWWHTERVLPPPRDHSVDELDRGADRDEDIPPRHIPGRDLGDDRVDEDQIDDVLADWRPGRSREERLERVDAGVEVLQWLRDSGRRVSRADVVAETYEEVAPSGQSRDSYWRKTARPALQKAADEGLVVIENREYKWR